jgi:protein required for attachment to host cells
MKQSKPREMFMLETGRLWFLVADGRRARILVEERRGATLAEPETLRFEIGPGDLYQPQDRAPRAHESVGSARHAMDGGRNLHEAEEEKFLRRVAASMAGSGDFAHLAIAAPPRALGILRTALPEAVRARVRGEAALDIVSETAAQLRERLRELLR